MKKLKYIFKRIFSMNFKQMKEKINDVHKESNKSKIFIFFDMINCAIKYQAGYMDYWLFRMYELNKNQRKTIMTRGKNDALIKKYNDKNFIHIFDNKDEFDKAFYKYLKREWMILNENNEKEFTLFIKDKEYIIVKPRNGSCGKGIEKIKVGDYSNNQLYTYLLEKKLIIIEEVIKQNEIMSNLNSSSINTIRIITVLKDNKVNVVAAYLRIGNANKFVDNFNSGGMVVPVEVNNGEIIYPALDKTGKLYEKHPLTDTNIIGFKTPMWDDVISLVKNLGLVIPQVGVVGWDIALTENYPLVVEGNNYPGHDIYQLPPHRTNGIGMLPKFEEFLK